MPSYSGFENVEEFFLKEHLQELLPKMLRKKLSGYTVLTDPA